MIEEMTPSRKKVNKLTQAILEEEDFIAPMATIVKNETQKALNARSEQENRLQNL